MQALSLRPVNTQIEATKVDASFNKDNVQGSNNSVQNDSSFSKMLKEAQQTQSTEGTSEKGTQVENTETSVNEDTVVQTLEKKILSEDVNQIHFEDKSNLLSSNDEAFFEPEMGECKKEVLSLQNDQIVEFSDEVVNKQTFETSSLLDSSSFNNDFSELVKKTEDSSKEKELPSASNEEKQSIIQDGVSLIQPTLLTIDTTKKDDIKSLDNQITEKSNIKSKKDNKKLFDVISIKDERTIVTQAEKVSNFDKSIKFDESGNAEITFNLPQTNNSSEISSLNDGTGVNNKASSFASLLSGEIVNNADYLVKTGSIILQDNKKGSINLILHPDELGNVKIRLELSDNQISGKIVVSSQEAYDAFKQSISSLKEAFSSGGYEAGSFDLTWSGANQNSANQQQQNSENYTRSEISINTKGYTYSDNTPDLPPETYSTGTSVNLVA